MITAGRLASRVNRAGSDLVEPPYLETSICSVDIEASDPAREPLAEAHEPKFFRERQRAASSGGLAMLDRVIPRLMKTGASDESKFRVILLIARRAKQIQAGAKPLIHKVAWKATRMAREEFRAGLIPYEILPAVAR